MLFSRESDQLRSSSHENMFRSHQLSWIIERYVLLDIYFGFLISLRKLKASKINLKT